MAEVEEEIIIIDESDAAGHDEESADTLELQEDSQKKKLIIFGAIGALLLIIIIVTLIVILKPADKVEEIYSMDFIEERLNQDESIPVEVSKLENMIAKANYLYSNGSQKKALRLYEKIAQYSESISQYNLGVAQLKNKQFEVALETFKKAITNGEKRCVSAINAAVCCVHLQNKKNFQYYIDLAYAYLPQENNSPLYSYYYTLIQYYNNNYFEALSSLKNPTTDEYPDIQKHLSAKINALFQNNYDAIENLEKNYTKEDSFSLGLLYARIGDTDIARKYFKEALQNNIEPVKSSLALSYINLKSGLVASAGTMIQNTTDMFPEEVYKPFPIKVKLKDEVFETTKAQVSYRSKFNNRFNKYSKIFYFSPYKIFNAEDSIAQIRKGTTNIYVDNIDNAKSYLKKSASSSSVNRGIVQAIEMALEFRTRDANIKLQSLAKIQPKHSILHYNLALTYAQMGNMKDAYKHFLKSYYLDAKNYHSAIYAIMSAQLINKDHLRLLSTIKESLSLEEDSEEIDLMRTLLYIADNNTISAADWLENKYKQRPFYLALEALIAFDLNNLNIAKKATTALSVLLPKDIVPHMMYIDAHFSEAKPKAYAFKVTNYLKLQKFSYNDLYYGPYITRYLYIQQNLITGRLYFLRKQLRDTLETTNKYTQEINSALALACLYDSAFEEAYVLYNNLIDNLRVRDAYTLFLGAVASTAASHHANAIALLELSKMKNKSILESRYALGLLYLEVKNNQGATIQFKRIGDKGFEPNFFTFDIDTDNLLLNKELAN